MPFDLGFMSHNFFHFFLIRDQSGARVLPPPNLRFFEQNTLRIPEYQSLGCLGITMPALCRAAELS